MSVVKLPENFTEGEIKHTPKRMFAALAFMFRTCFKYSKLLLPLTFIIAVFKSIVPLITIFMSKLITDELLGGKDGGLLTRYVLLTVVSTFALHLISNTLSRLREVESEKANRGIALEMGLRTVTMDYEQIESAEKLKKMEQMRENLTRRGGIMSIINDMMEIVSNVITLLGIIYILSQINFIVILMLIAVMAVRVVMNIKLQRFNYDRSLAWIARERKLGIYRKILRDYSYGKDFRIFDASPLMLERLSNLCKGEMTELHKENLEYAYKNNILPMFLSEFQSVAIYIFLAYKALTDPLFTLGSLTMCVTAVSTFSSKVYDSIWSLHNMTMTTKFIGLFMDYLFDKDDKMHGGTLEVDIAKPHIIEFKNVSFRYSNADEDTLKNISIKIPLGKKLAIVGQNGAGKTTFIKLLMRFYDPHEGEILLDGVNIKEYKYESYQSLFSVVFQDYKIFAFSVSENVAPPGDGVSAESVSNALNKAGLSERLKKMNNDNGNGLDTFMTKRFDKDGVEFSGGEQQKVAIARALHRDAPFVVLDEPTAALDPIAEFEIYSSFNELTQGKTSIFISHRLSSCRFCDKIAVFDDGRITEFGSHDELAANNALYTKMFKAQAQYYI